VLLAFFLVYNFDQNIDCLHNTKTLIVFIILSSGVIAWADL